MPSEKALELWFMNVWKLIWISMTVIRLVFIRFRYTNPAEKRKQMATPRKYMEQTPLSAEVAILYRGGISVLKT